MKRMERFFEAVQEYLTWNKDMLKRGEAALEAYAKHPRDWDYDCNLHRTPDGQLWGMVNGVSGEGRVDAPHQRAKEVEISWAELCEMNPERGDYDKEWSWGPKSLNVGFEWNPRYIDRHSENTEHGVVMDKVSIRVAEQILEKRASVEDWIRTRAGSGNTTERDSDDRAFDAMVWEFTDVRRLDDLHDSGMMRITLQALLDELALGRQVRQYAC